VLRDTDDSATQRRVVAIWLDTTTRQFVSRNPDAQLRNVGMFDRRHAQNLRAPDCSVQLEPRAAHDTSGGKPGNTANAAAETRNATCDTALTLDAIAVR